MDFFLLRQIQSSLLHSGRDHMLAKLREQYWPIHAPSAITKIISNCVTRHMSKVEEQKMASLSKDHSRSFEVKVKMSGLEV